MGDLGPRANLLREVSIERDRQEMKFGAKGRTCASREMPEGEKYLVLGEEFGEVGRAVLEGDREGLLQELIQVAAVAVAWAEALQPPRSGRVSEATVDGQPAPAVAALLNAVVRQPEDR